jgi:hypothetical protein
MLPRTSLGPPPLSPMRPLRRQPDAALPFTRQTLRA